MRELTPKELLAQELDLTVEQLDQVILKCARSCKRRTGPTTYNALQQAVQVTYATNRLVGDDLQAHNPTGADERTNGAGKVVKRTPVFDREPVLVFPEDDEADRRQHEQSLLEQASKS